MVEEMPLVKPAGTWKMSSALYVDKLVGQSRWTEVTEIVFPCWPEISRAEKEALTTLLKKWWIKTEEEYVNSRRHQLASKKRKIDDVIGEAPASSSVEWSPRRTVTTNETLSEDVWTSTYCVEQNAYDKKRDKLFGVETRLDYNKLTYNERVDFRVSTLLFLKNISQIRILTDELASVRLGNMYPDSSFQQESDTRSSVGLKLKTQQKSHDSTVTKESVPTQRKRDPRLNRPSPTVLISSTNPYAEVRI